MSFRDSRKVKPVISEHFNDHLGLGLLFDGPNLDKSIGIPCGSSEVPTPWAVCSSQSAWLHGWAQPRPEQEPARRLRSAPRVPTVGRHATPYDPNAARFQSRRTWRSAPTSKLMK